MEEQKEGVQMEGKSLERLFEFVKDKAAVYMVRVTYTYTYTYNPTYIHPSSLHPTTPLRLNYFAFSYLVMVL